jgi:hypothetical protein
MQLRRPALIYLAGATGGLLVVCIVCASATSGNSAGELGLAMGAFALMIGAPIGVLCWFGSVTDIDDRKKLRRGLLRKEQREASLFAQTLADLQAEAAHARPLSRRLVTEAPSVSQTIDPRIPPPATQAVSARMSGRLAAFAVTVASTVGLMGCFQTVDPAVWPMVQPGMPAPDLVALAGAPQQIKTNGTKEIWQYCDDFLRRRADYYVSVFMESDRVVSVRPLPVASYSGCQDFYRTTY